MNINEEKMWNFFFFIEICKTRANIESNCFRTNGWKLFYSMFVKYSNSTWEHGWYLQVRKNYVISEERLIIQSRISHQYRAVDNSFIFQREMDDYGKLFSIIESFAKWFPELSGYKAGRDSSMELYNIYKVFKSARVIAFSFCSNRLKYILLSFITENRWWTNSNVWCESWTAFHWRVHYKNA